MRNIPGIARRGTRMFLECRKILSLWCQKRLREQWQRSCAKCLAERRVVFYALSVNLTSFSWTHKLVFTPDQLRRHPRTQVKKTRNQLRIVPRMTLILKQGFLRANPHKIAAQMMPTTALNWLLMFHLFQRLSSSSVRISIIALIGILHGTIIFHQIWKKNRAQCCNFVTYFLNLLLNPN